MTDDEFAEKFRLQTLRDELREKASRFRTDYDLQRSDAALIAELAARRSQVDAIHKHRVDFITQAGGGSDAASGADHGGKAAINHDIADAQGIGEINARIARIEAVLDDRGVEYSSE